MRRMPPPEQHVRFIENRLRQPLFRFIERRRADNKIFMRPQNLRQGRMDALRVDLSDDWILTLVNEFVLDGDTDGSGHDWIN
jgi:hypothetical protein